MFLRHTKRKKDGKEHGYWSIVENRRVGGGRVVQRPLLYLSEINDSQELAWRKSIAVLEEGAAAPRPLSLVALLSTTIIRIVSSNIPSLVVTSRCCSIPSGATATGSASGSARTGARETAFGGDRGFESCFLHRRVCCEPDFRGPFPSSLGIDSDGGPRVRIAAALPASAAELERVEA